MSRVLTNVTYQDERNEVKQSDPFVSPVLCKYKREKFLHRVIYVPDSYVPTVKSPSRVTI